MSNSSAPAGWISGLGPVHGPDQALKHPLSPPFPSISDPTAVPPSLGPVLWVVQIPEQPEQAPSVAQSSQSNSCAAHSGHPNWTVTRTMGPGLAGTVMVRSTGIACVAVCPGQPLHAEWLLLWPNCSTRNACSDYSGIQVSHSVGPTPYGVAAGSGMQGEGETVCEPDLAWGPILHHRQTLCLVWV